jgi:MFS family permease
LKVFRQQLIFLKIHPRLLGHGFAVMAFSSLAQTSVLAQSIPFIRESFGLSVKEMGLLYSGATLLAGLGLTTLGRANDRWPILPFSQTAMLCLGLAFLLLGGSFHVSCCFVAFFFIRLIGQTLLAQTVVLPIALTFERDRGKALGFISLGRSLGEGILPTLLVFLAVKWGWRWSFFWQGLLLILTLLPLSAMAFQKGRFPVRQRERDSKQMTWSDVISKRPHCFLTMLVNAILPCFLTGLFFHQQMIADFKGWSLALMAQSFSVYALGKWAGDMIWGICLDLWGARTMRLFLFIPVFLGLGLLARGGSEREIAWGYMSLLGLSASLSMLSRDIYWAELFGAEAPDLGTWRSMDGACLVFLSSLTPWIFSWCSEKAGRREDFLAILMICCALGSLFYFILNRYEPRSQR